MPSENYIYGHLLGYPIAPACGETTFVGKVTFEFTHAHIDMPTIGLAGLEAWSGLGGQIRRFRGRGRMLNLTVFCFFPPLDDSSNMA